MTLRRIKMNKPLTNHAIKRLNQRGISHKTLEYLLENGQTAYAPGGAIKIFITRRDANAAISRYKKKIKIIERAMNKNVIEKDGTILTIYHDTR